MQQKTKIRNNCILCIVLFAVKREKRCGNLFESLAESSRSRVAEREATEIPGSQARSSRSSGTEERHRRFRGSAGPPGEYDNDLPYTILYARINDAVATITSFERAIKKKKKSAVLLE